MEKGTLKNNKVHLKDHEYKTICFLLEQGYNIELIPPLQVKGFHTPDLVLNGVSWEMKAPEGDGKKTIQNNMQIGGKQAKRLIIDLRRCRMSQEQAIKDIKYHFGLSKRIKQIMIITKDEKLIDLKK